MSRANEPWLNLIREYKVIFSPDPLDPLEDGSPCPFEIHHDEKVIWMAENYGQLNCTYDERLRAALEQTWRERKEQRRRRTVR